MHKMTAAISTVAVCLLTIRGYTAEEGNDETPHLQKLRFALQAKHGDLPMVSVNTRQEDVSFTTIDLTPSLTTVEGKNYYAFRFTTPKERGPLIWSFRVPRGTFSWYIVPVKGRMQGFTHFDQRRYRRKVSDLGAPGDTFVLQRLPAHNLQPNRDYIMWFGIKEDGVPKIMLSLNVLRSGSSYTYTDTFPMLYQKQSKRILEGTGNNAPDPQN